MIKSLNYRNIVAPKEGFSPQIGTLVSMMNRMRYVILQPVYGMSAKKLDYLNQDNANSLGAVPWHLAATTGRRNSIALNVYQLITFRIFRK